MPLTLIVRMPVGKNQVKNQGQSVKSKEKSKSKCEK